jgi:hypothetical protein
MALLITLTTLLPSKPRTANSLLPSKPRTAYSPLFFRSTCRFESEPPDCRPKSAFFWAGCQASRVMYCLSRTLIISYFYFSSPQLIGAFLLSRISTYSLCYPLGDSSLLPSLSDNLSKPCHLGILCILYLLSFLLANAPCAIPGLLISRYPLIRLLAFNLC